MRYCPPNSTLSDYWIHHGFGLCFFTTLSTSLVGLVVLALGLIQLQFYRKYSTRLDARILPHNRLYRVQLFLHWLLTGLSIVTLALRHSLDADKGVYGYEILDLVGNIVTWPICVALILVERRFQLPTSPGHGHGVILLLTWTLAFIFANLSLLSVNQHEWFFHLETVGDEVEFGLWIVRYAATIAVFAVGIKAPGISQARDYVQQINEDDPEQQRRSASEGSTWRGLWRKLRVLLPYLWPKKSYLLQLNVILCFILLAGVRVANVFVPIYYKKIVDALTPSHLASLPSEARFCWDLILVFVTLKFVQGGGTGGQGMLNQLRTFLWIKVQQYTTREIQVGLFSHLHTLSLRWHLGRKTGEVLRVMDRGTASVNGLLSYLVFNIIPTMADIVIAIIFFTSVFNYLFGLIVFVTMVVYLGTTIYMTEWRTKYRRNMNLADNDQRTKSVDSMLNFETVKYFGAEPYEIDRYSQAIVTYQTEEFKSLASLTLLNFIQSLIMNGALLAGSLYCAYLVADDALTVGDYVLFGTYILQLTVPLNWIGTLYRVIQESFVNMENMLDLLDEEPEVSDEAGAPDLLSATGKIEFRDVSFGYSPERTILKNLSFTAMPGQTVAFVGPTGAGKSTVIRLLFRFYDVQRGEILIDGQNVKRLTQSSVRGQIGVVPQDTVLFNDTIRYNIRYARPDASDHEVEAAATHADMHEKILGFPDGYDTKVGERGLKLSGGEKQRVAIARTLLKAPRIVLLDEATSALDTRTERNIQNALSAVCRDRTTIVVAHRLSTVTNADCIHVLKEGEVVERGTHDELLAVGGEYAAMWHQQSTAGNNDGGEKDANAKKEE